MNSEELKQWIAEVREREEKFGERIRTLLRVNRDLLAACKEELAFLDGNNCLTQSLLSKLLRDAIDRSEGEVRP